MDGPSTTDPRLAKLHRILPVDASSAYMDRIRRDLGGGVRIRRDREGVVGRESGQWAGCRTGYLQAQATGWLHRQQTFRASDDLLLTQAHVHSYDGVAACV